MAQLFAPEAAQPAPGTRDALPRFWLVVSPGHSNGWHSAIMLREVATPDFFVRSLAVPWPFVIARPAPRTRQPKVVVSPEEMSPARTSPSRRLVVNWGWERRNETTDQLRFYVKCKGPFLLWRRRKLALRVQLKVLAQPRRQIALEVTSGIIDWRSGSEDTSISGDLWPPVEA